MKSETLTQLLADRAANRPVVLATHLESGEEHLIYPGRSASDALSEAAATALREDKSRRVESDDGPYFLHAFNPPLRMIIVGAVHIAQPLSRMAALAGYDVVMVDPRGAFLDEERFPGVQLTSEWPDDALKELAIDARTAIVTLTHDPKLDDPALHVALRSPAFYVGSLGSKRTHAKRLARLDDDGFTAEECARIQGPIGLDIGAKSPAEIAIAILAQVTEQLRAEG